MSNANYFPKTIDINPTAKCNLHCSFCWGPDHRLPDALRTQDWQRLIEFFRQGGTTAVVFTGGEPLIRKDLPELMRFAKNQGMTVTLSTNGILLPKRANEVLPWCDEIGLPLDGSTKDRNAMMRLGNPGAFEAALKAAELVHDRGKEIQTTIRTVASKVNCDDIPNIAVLLDDHQHLFRRWKVYQFTPASIGGSNRNEHEIDDVEFHRLSKSLKRFFPKLPLSVYPSSERRGRYLFVGPTGDIYGVGSEPDYVYVANFLTTQPADINSAVQNLVDFSANALHGSSQVASAQGYLAATT